MSSFEFPNENKMPASGLGTYLVSILVVSILFWNILKLENVQPFTKRMFFS